MQFMYGYIIYKYQLQTFEKHSSLYVLLKRLILVNGGSNILNFRAFFGTEGYRG